MKRIRIERPKAPPSAPGVVLAGDPTLIRGLVAAEPATS